MSRVGAAALVIAALVILYWALLFTRQRSILFPAPDPATAPPRPADARSVWLETPAGHVEAWYLPPLSARNSPAPLLIFTHGNGELIDYWPGEFGTPRRWGMGVLLVEYPGYGRSEGQPSQATVTAAVLAAYDWAAGNAEVDRSRIVAYGRSLGGGAATVLARSRPTAALILESSFTSVHAFARRMGAPAFLVRDRFDNREGVRELEIPILIAHGERDGIIPVSHAHALRAAQPRSELVLLPCGHNDCPRPWRPIERFLRSNRIL
ncbi:MAG: alpha/beta hydrolase [Gemmatimonadota bacterium]|nr:alpha/beta hydrolase [Gemmatimonadota bacterium]